MLAAQRTQQAREHDCSHGRRVAHQVQHGVCACGRQPREEGRLAVEASRGEQHLAPSRATPTGMACQPGDEKPLYTTAIVCGIAPYGSTAPARCRATGAGRRPGPSLPTAQQDASPTPPTAIGSTRCSSPAACRYSSPPSPIHRLSRWRTKRTTQTRTHTHTHTHTITHTAANPHPLASPQRHVSVVVRSSESAVFCSWCLGFRNHLCVPGLTASHQMRLGVLIDQPPHSITLHIHQHRVRVYPQ